MTLAATLSVKLSAQHTKTADLSSLDNQLLKALSFSFSDGAGAGQANVLYQDRRTIAASGNEDIDLNGVLSNVFGDAANFARIKAVLIIAAEGNTNNVQVTRPASNGVPLFMAAGDGISLAPGEFFLWGSKTAAGKAVTASTGDLLNIANSAGSTSVEYDIIVLGAAT